MVGLTPGLLEDHAAVFAEKSDPRRVQVIMIPEAVLKHLCPLKVSWSTAIGWIVVEKLWSRNHQPSQALH